MFYGGKNSDSLTYLRYIKYMKMASSVANVKPNSFPPTEQAAVFHIYWVYFQLREWNTLMKSNLNAKNWGMEIRRCLVDTSYDRSRTCPRLASKGHKMQLSSNFRKPMQWKTMRLLF